MAKRHVPPLVGRKVRLRLLDAADLPTTLQWRNDDAIRPWFFNSDVISAAIHERWWNQYRDRDDDFVFVIEDVDRNVPVGQASVYHVDWHRKSAEFGRLVIGDPAARGRGFAREAVDLLTAFAFEQLQLVELMLQMKAGNTVAGTIYEACGYRVVDRSDEIVTMVLSRP